MRTSRVLRPKGGAVSVPENCPLCPGNGQVSIVAEAHEAYLVKALNADIEDCYLIVPKAHITDPMMLPGRWWIDVRSLFEYIPWRSSSAAYNHSSNYGEAAGQTLEHYHLWFIPRRETILAPSFKKGLATLIKDANESTFSAS